MIVVRFRLPDTNSSATVALIRFSVSQDDQPLLVVQDDKRYIPITISDPFQQLKEHQYPALPVSLGWLFGVLTNRAILPGILEQNEQTSENDRYQALVRYINGEYDTELEKMSVVMQAGKQWQEAFAQHKTRKVVLATALEVFEKRLGWLPSLSVPDWYISQKVQSFMNGTPRSWIVTGFYQGAVHVEIDQQGKPYVLIYSSNVDPEDPLVVWGRYSLEAFVENVARGVWRPVITRGLPEPDLRVLRRRVVSPSGSKTEKEDCVIAWGSSPEEVYRAVASLLGSFVLSSKTLVGVTLFVPQEYDSDDFENAVLRLLSESGCKLSLSLSPEILKVCKEERYDFLAILRYTNSLAT